MRVIISAGGTGGHIYPALAIINKIKEKNPNSEFIYIGTTDRMESTIIPSKNIPYEGIEMKGLNRKNIFANIGIVSCYLKAIKSAKKIIASFKPDIVIGVGGYITAPVIYAACKLGYKTIIHEQNSIPGLTNKMLSKRVDKICVSLEDSLEYFPKDKTIYTGNPRSEECLSVKAINKSELGLSSNKKLVLIVMGSLGSLTINNKLKEIVMGFNKKSYEVLLVTGKNYYDSFSKLDVPSNVFLVPYLENMLSVMKKVDLIVTRCGASTIAEITALGIPSILVPSPYVTHDHQTKNALSLVNKDAGVLLLEKDFDSDHLISLVDGIFNDLVLYSKLKKNVSSMGVKNSASKIYDIIVDVVKEEK